MSYTAQILAGVPTEAATALLALGTFLVDFLAAAASMISLVAAGGAVVWCLHKQPGGCAPASEVVHSIWPSYQGIVQPW